MASVIEYIEQSAETCGGKPRVAGTRIRVQDIAIWHDRLGWSADEIVSKHTQLSLASVYAALAYYHEHRAEIDEEIVHGKQAVEELKQRFPSKVTKPTSAE